MEQIGSALYGGIDGLIERLGAERRVEPSDGDTYGDDGLLRCGTCGEPKEYRMRGSGRIVRVICACQLKERDRRDAEARIALEDKNAADLAAYSLTDERFRRSTFDTWVSQSPDDERVLRICRNYADHFAEMYAANTGLIFYGSPGTGKTFAAACIANELMARRVPVLVTSIIRLTAGAFGDGLTEALGRMNAARLLVLDDFGAERNTEFKAEQIFAVIDARYASGKPMLVTTNLTDFKTETDVRRRRVYDRIFETCVPVKMDGVSRRRAEGQKKRDSARAILEGGIEHALV